MMLNIEGRSLVLIVDGWRFHSTSDSEASVKECEVNVWSYTPDSEVKVEPFGVHISTAHPHTLEVQEWHKVEGYSLWYRRKRQLSQ